MGGCCSDCSDLRRIQSQIRECKEFLENLYIQEIRIKSSVNASHALGANVPFRNPKNHITIKIFGLEKIKRYMGYRDFYMEDRRYSK